MPGGAAATGAELADLARELFREGDYRGCMYCLLLSLRQLRRRAGPPEVLTRTLYSLGYVSCLVGDVGRAERYLRQGLAVAGAPDDHYGMLYLNLGICHFMRGQEELADRAWRQAEECFARSGNERFRARCAVNRAALLQERDPGSALALLTAALATLQGLEDEEAYRIYTELARTHLRLGSVDDAATCVEAAMQASARAGDAGEFGAALFTLGEVWLARGRPEQAREAWREALAILRHANAWEYKRSLERVLALGIQDVLP